MRTPENLLRNRVVAVGMQWCKMIRLFMFKSLPTFAVGVLASSNLCGITRYWWSWP